MTLTREQILAAEETEGETHMRHYCDAMEAGTQPPAETLQYFNAAFQKIQEGTDPKEALRIKRKPGRKSTHNSTEPYFQAAIMVELLRADGDSWISAVKAVAKETHKDYETVKGYHRDYKDLAKALVVWVRQIEQQRKE